MDDGHRNDVIAAGFAEGGAAGQKGWAYGVLLRPKQRSSSLFYSPQLVVMQPPAPPSSEAPPPPPSDPIPLTPSQSAASADAEDDLQPALALPAQRKKSIPKKDIPSMEEIVKKSEKARAALARPVYLNKAQREAIERRKQEEKEALHTKIYGSSENSNDNNGNTPLDIEASVKIKFGKKVESPSKSRKEHISTNRWYEFPDDFAKDHAKLVRDGHSPGNLLLRQNGNHPSKIPTGPRAQRQADAPTEPAAMRNDPAIVGNGNKGVKRPADEDLDVDAIRIKQRYMGSDMKESKFSAQKKRKRTTEKKFSFEWNPEDDTTVDANPIYQDRIEASFFGKGRLAGYDDNMAEAKAQEYARALMERDKESGAQRAAELLKMEERRKQLSRRTAIDKHWSEKKLEDMRERDWRIFKEDFNISTKSVSGINPMRNWEESGLGDEILKIVKQVGYDEPTPVQRACIPIALCSRDLIGVAVTGSGKTAAFILPLLVYIRSLPPIEKYNAADGPYAIVLAPTRELAQQIETEANKFAAPLGMKCISIVGGHSIEEQAFKLRDGASIIIATPGRLVDCLERRVLVLSQCCYVVMDEADRMVDMGFEEPVNKILDALPVANEKPDSDVAENPKVCGTTFESGNKFF